MMCKEMGKDQYSRQLTTDSWYAIFEAIEDQQAFDHWHQLLADLQ